MSEASTYASTEVESTSSRAPSTEPPALQDTECLPMEVAETEQAAEAPMSPDLRHWCHNLTPNFGCVCRLCGARYDTQWELRRHMDHLHPKSSPVAYVCAHCDRGFSKFYRMARHLATVAMGVAERRGGTAADDTRWPGPKRISSRLSAGVVFRRPARRQRLYPRGSG